MVIKNNIFGLVFLKCRDFARLAILIVERKIRITSTTIDDYKWHQVHYGYKLFEKMN